MRFIPALSALLAFLPADVHAQTFSGPAKVIDGDGLSVSGIEIRLFGIDAPEGMQMCSRDGREWPCGEASTGRLRSLIEGKTVTCRPHGGKSYDRTVAICSAGGFELNRTMVTYGWATAYRSISQDYVADEERAKAERRGIWDSTFELPSDYRRAQQFRAEQSAQPRVPATRASAPSAFAGGCVIKGNRNRRGQWIYHLPGMPYYAQTRAEEWFCSEAQAQAAGYRRAIVK